MAPIQISLASAFSIQVINTMETKDYLCIIYVLMYFRRKRERNQNYRTKGKRLPLFCHENCWGLLSKDSSQKCPVNYLAPFISNRDGFHDAGLRLWAVPSEYNDIAHCLNRSSAVIWHQSSNIIASLNSLKRDVFYHRESSVCSFFIFNQALAL